MKYKIKYYCIQSDHILAVPEFSHSEFVQARSEAALRKYIESQKDPWGNPYKKSSDKFMKFDYISRAGAIRVKVYRPPEAKKI